MPSQGRPALVAVNKCDLTKPAPPPQMSPVCPPLATSALTGEGIPALRERILALATGGAASEPGMLTSLRHHQAITTALVRAGRRRAGQRKRHPP